MKITPMKALKIVAVSMKAKGISKSGYLEMCEEAWPVDPPPVTTTYNRSADHFPTESEQTDDL